MTGHPSRNRHDSTRSHHILIAQHIQTPDTLLEVLNGREMYRDAERDRLALRKCRRRQCLPLKT